MTSRGPSEIGSGRVDGIRTSPWRTPCYKAGDWVRKRPSATSEQQPCGRRKEAGKGSSGQQRRRRRPSVDKRDKLNEITCEPNIKKVTPQKKASSAPDCQTAESLGVSSILLLGPFHSRSSSQTDPPNSPNAWRTWPC